LRTGEHLPAPEIAEVRSILMEHLDNLHQFYGEPMGARIARKHVSWYLQTHDSDGQFRRVFNALDNPQAQVDALEEYFKTLAAN
jgi:tRNA-dihydrouridine synthase B